MPWLSRLHTNHCTGNALARISISLWFWLLLSHFPLIMPRRGGVRFVSLMSPGFTIENRHPNYWWCRPKLLIGPRIVCTFVFCYRTWITLFTDYILNECVAFFHSLPNLIELLQQDLPNLQIKTSRNFSLHYVIALCNRSIAASFFSIICQCWCCTLYHYEIRLALENLNISSKNNHDKS